MNKMRVKLPGVHRDDIADRAPRSPDVILSNWEEIVEMTVKYGNNVVAHTTRILEELGTRPNSGIKSQNVEYATELY